MFKIRCFAVSPVPGKLTIMFYFNERPRHQQIHMELHCCYPFKLRYSGQLMVKILIHLSIAENCKMKPSSDIPLRPISIKRI